MNKKYDYVILSGGFDPMHSGHVSMIHEANMASKFGVIILLNSDEWLARKKGKSFMNWQERRSILWSMRGVTNVFPVDDSDGTVVAGLSSVADRFGNHTLAFGNGGDRKLTSTPSAEQALCNARGIDVLFGVGGDTKQNSSSTILADWARQTEQRPWGEFTTYEVGSGYKVKTLKVNPGQRLSLQYHNHRDEHWTVLSGSGFALVGDHDNSLIPLPLSTGVNLHIPKNILHRVECTGNDSLVILEAQIGDYVGEDDIVRIQDDYAR